MSGSADASEVLGEGNASSVSKDILEILLSFGKAESLDGLGSLVSVFIMDSQVFSRGFGD